MLVSGPLDAVPSNRIHPPEINIDLVFTADPGKLRLNQPLPSSVAFVKEAELRDAPRLRRDCIIRAIRRPMEARALALMRLLLPIVGAWALLGTAVIGLAPASAQTTAPSEQTRTLIECGSQSTKKSSTRAFVQGMGGIYDEFDRSNLTQEYDVHDGPGFFSVGGQLRYFAMPHHGSELGMGGFEFSGDSKFINLDTLGRPYVPSLNIARHFSGEMWTFETKVNYDFTKPSNGRSITIAIDFGDFVTRGSNAVKIIRSNDNPGNPKERGALGVSVSEDEKVVVSKPITLNTTDAYFFCVRRAGRHVAVLVSNDGKNYSPVLDHTFGSLLKQTSQSIVINGGAFAPGASADIEYISVKPEGTQPALQTEPVKRSIFRVHGSPNRLAMVNAKDVMSAIREGSDVDVRFANIIGPLNLGLEPQLPRVKSITFKFCSFTDRITGTSTVFEDDVSIVDSTMNQAVNFSGARFVRKVDFSGSTFIEDTRFIHSRFEQGASFSGTTFKTRPFFRVAQFDQPTSFYYANFADGADFSSVTFGKDVSFADFSFGRTDSADASQPDITFFGTKFKKKAMFISSLQRPKTVLGEEISFQQAEIDELIVSAGDPNPWVLGIEQTGKGLWVLQSGITLRNARVAIMTFKDVEVKGIVDLRGLTYPERKDSIFFLNAAFNVLRMDSWPVGRVVTTGETRERLIASLEAASNSKAARAAYFDLLPVSNYYDNWRNTQNANLRPFSYRDYTGYQALTTILQPLWLISNYCTSITRVMVTGLLLILFFSVVFLVLDWGRGHLVIIEKPLEFKTRLSETPVLSFGEKAINVQHDTNLADGRLEKVRRNMWVFFDSVRIAFTFSLNTIAKIGFGNIRVRTQDSYSRILVRLAWVAWTVGYAWYLLLIYTLSVNPILKGIL